VELTDLVTRLTEAAAEAIAKERLSLEHKPWELRGIMLEIEMANSGAILDATCDLIRRYVFRSQKEPAA
jgi:hypothetical protein